jgi:hypothetical protein
VDREIDADENTRDAIAIRVLGLGEAVARMRTDCPIRARSASESTLSVPETRSGCSTSVFTSGLARV